MEKLENILNDKQCEAVRQTEGPLLVLAGAGSGKTRVLTHRVAYLIEECNVAPWNILAITFTNKAAKEMKERVFGLLGDRARYILVSTFHSMCVRILRKNISRLGYGNDFSIYDTTDQKTLMKKVYKDLNVDRKQFKERAVLSLISSSKNEGVSADEFMKMADGYREKKIAECYKRYEVELMNNNALDFDDLILKTLELFKKFPDVLAYYQERFKYIMVDEYQDTNTIQFELIRMMAEKHRNICVVGDDDQSIYKFRGAKIENILSFEKVFKGTKIIKLEQNYRSTKNILNVANALIANNNGRKEKRLWTDREEGAEVIFKEFESEKDESRAIIDLVDDRERAFSEQAILYRTNAQSRAFEEECVKRNIPYKLIGGVNFYQRKEIKDLVAYLKLIYNIDDGISFARIINVPKRGVGAASIARLEDYAIKNNKNIFYAAQRAEDAGLKGKALKSVREFTSLLLERRRLLLESGYMDEDVLIDESADYSISRILKDIKEDLDYQKELKSEGETVYLGRMENIDEFIGKAMEYENDHDEPKLGDFLQEVSLISDLDRTDENADAITLMTIHSAKGLEFPRVYLAGMNEELFPSIMSMDSLEDIEEERRLCYVGITRAQDELFMTAARNRFIHGDFKVMPPSRFISEIPDPLMNKIIRFGRGHIERVAKSFEMPDYDDSVNPMLKMRLQKAAGSLKSGPGIPDSYKMTKISDMGKSEGLDYKEGDRVSHKKFGEGIVLSIAEGKRDFEVMVDFDKFGKKRMFASFARLLKL